MHRRAVDNTAVPLFLDDNIINKKLVLYLYKSLIALWVIPNNGHICLNPDIFT